jgi:uncharacterized protein (DUF2141 family)
MDWKHYLSFFTLIILLGSCAQLGFIEGGQKDIFAPKIIVVDPPNESLSFASKKITLQFDEYIKLNNPIESIIVNPNDVKINAKVDKKTLILELEGNLKENTTYQITFNSAIKDINEGNDSLMRYVFSTGLILDTLKYSGFTADAYTGERQSNVLVGLYELTDSISKTKPIYFSKTDKKGEFEFNYLKEGNYKVVAIDDQNKDALFQITENTGFRDSVLALTENKTDSLPVFISANPLPNKITSRSYVYPRLVKIASNYSIQNLDLNLNRISIEARNKFFYKEDSLAILLPNLEQTDFYILANDSIKTDTLDFKVTESSKKNIDFYEILPLSKDISISKSFMFLFSDEIINLNDSLVRIYDKDSLLIAFEINFNLNTLAFKIDSEVDKAITLFIPKEAIEFKNQKFTKDIKATLINKSKNEFGTLIFTKLKFENHYIIELIKNEKMYKSIKTMELIENPNLSFIEPGEYSFRVILDENKNGKWDHGSILEKKQAEKVLHFPEKIKVRANWETEISFDPK